jgi:hypothetical protein
MEEEAVDYCAVQLAIMAEVELEEQKAELHNPE